MAYDEDLADRLRAALQDVAGIEASIEEKRMFGGLAFLVGGHMAVAASGEGGLLVRCDPDRTDELLALDGVSTMVMRGRAMSGWLRVATPPPDDDETLARWVDTGVGYVRTLPPK